jgi:hypothetical protein
MMMQLQPPSTFGGTNQPFLLAADWSTAAMATAGAIPYGTTDMAMAQLMMHQTGGTMDLGEMVKNKAK